MKYARYNPDLKTGLWKNVVTLVTDIAVVIGTVATVIVCSFVIGYLS